MLFSIGSLINMHEEYFSHCYFWNDVLRMKMYGRLITFYFCKKGKFVMKEKMILIEKKCNFIHK